MNHKKYVVLLVTFFCCNTFLYADVTSIQNAIQQSLMMLEKAQKLGPKEKAAISENEYQHIATTVKEIDDMRALYDADKISDAEIENLQKAIAMGTDVAFNGLLLSTSPEHLTQWHKLTNSLEKLKKKFQELQLQKGVEHYKQKMSPPTDNAVKILHHNLIIFTDTSESSGQAITNSLQVALCQQAAPILVSPHLLGNVVQQEAAFRAYIGRDISTWLLQHWHVRTLKKTHKFSAHIEQTHFLLVPKQYLENLKKQFPEVTEDKLLGLRFNDTLSLKDELTDKSFISSLQGGDVPVSADSFANWLLTLQEDYPYAVWNLFMSGHGNLTPKNGAPLETLFSHRRYNDPFDLSAYDVHIAGLPLLEFRKLLQQLQQRATNFFAYASCYAGGYNLYLTYIASLLNTKGSVLAGTIKPNFTIVALSVGDFTTNVATDYTAQCSVSEYPIPEGYLNFPTFFEKLMHYTDAYITGKTVQPARFSDTELQNIVIPLSTANGNQVIELMNTPQVLFPSTDTFTFFPLHPEKIFFLTQAKIRAAVQERVAIDFPLKTRNVKVNSVQKKVMPQAICLPIADIPIMLAIDTSECTMPYIISLLPGIGLHSIAAISAHKTTAQDFLNAFDLNKKANLFARYFYIEKLQLKYSNDLHMLKNFASGDTVEIFNVLIMSKNTQCCMFFTDKNKQIYCAAVLHDHYRILNAFHIAKQPLADNPSAIIENYIDLFARDEVKAALDSFQMFVKKNSSAPTSTYAPYEQYLASFNPLRKLIQQKTKEDAATILKTNEIEKRASKQRSDPIIKALHAEDTTKALELLQPPIGSISQPLIALAFTKLVETARAIVKQQESPSEQQKKILSDLLTINRLLGHSGITMVDTPEISRLKLEFDKLLFNSQILQDMFSDWTKTVKKI